MSDIMLQDDIENLLNDLAGEVPEINDNSKKLPPFNFNLDFKYKNEISPFDRSTILNLISHIIANYKIKLLEIKKGDEITCMDVISKIVPDYNLRDALEQKKEYNQDGNHETFIKEYSLNGEKFYISTSVSLINLLLDRNYDKEKDIVSEFAAKLYFFDIIKSYLNQYINQKGLSLEENDKEKKQSKENDTYLIFEILLAYEEKLVPSVFALSTGACHKLTSTTPSEITIHSNDYYKKQGGYVVIASNKESILQPTQKGTTIIFDLPADSKYNLILGNKLVAKGNVGTYYHEEIYTRFTVTDLEKTPQEDYFQTNKTSLVFATTDSKKALKQIETTGQQGTIQLKLDTEISAKTILLIQDAKITATVNVTQQQNNLTATIETPIFPPIPI